MPEPIDLNVLAAVARAATPGLWLQDEHEDGDEGFGPTGMSLGWGVHTGTDGCDPDLDVRHYDPEIRTGSVEDATYIATFDPPTVLALIERLRRAEGRLAAVDDDRHVVEIGEGGWALEHPLRCREAGTMLTCDPHVLVKEDCDASGGPPRGLAPGRYLVHVEKGGAYYLREPS